MEISAVAMTGPRAWGKVLPSVPTTFQYLPVTWALSKIRGSMAEANVADRRESPVESISVGRVPCLGANHYPKLRSAQGNRRWASRLAAVGTSLTSREPSFSS